MRKTRWVRAEAANHIFEEFVRKEYDLRVFTRRQKLLGA